VQAASFCRLFLIDVLDLANAADGAAKADANVERHELHLRREESDTYTADESHRINAFDPDSKKFAVISF